MTIVLCNPMHMEGRTIKKIASYWHGSSTSHAFLFTDGTVCMLKENGDSGFTYVGREEYNALPTKLMSTLGGMAVDLGLVTQAQYEEWKAKDLERRQKETEEADRRLYEDLKKKFEPNTNKEK